MLLAVCWQLQLFCKVGLCVVGFVRLANVLQGAVAHEKLCIKGLVT